MWDSRKRKDNQTAGENFTVLGKDVRFNGIVHFEGTVQLDSCFEGEIHTNGILVVGEHAVIRGTLTVGTLISSGKIQGDVTASEKVQLLKTAVQIGDVHSPVFSIEEGAYFKGFADMGAGLWVEESSTGVEPLSDLTLRRNKARPQLLENDMTH